MEAQALWRDYPGEIASDLSRYHRLRIRDWHQGVMCSYELLELLEFMPDEGAFKTAVRDGEPSERDEAIRQIANETAVLRAGMVPGASGDDYGSRLFIPNYKRRENAEQAAQASEARDSLTPRVDRED
jgi:hypothetical protein